MDSPPQPISVERVLLVGAGSIGIGVARSLAAHGFATTVLSRNPARLHGELPASVEIVSALPKEAPGLVIESVPEVRELKISLYEQVESAYAGIPVLATNSSGFSIDELAQRLSYPERFVGMHYLYPADSSEFVEVTRQSRTAQPAIDAVVGVLRACGKTPIVLNRAVVGALVNRLQHALLREAYFLIGEGVVTAEQVDDVARRLLAPRMCVTGLLEQKDISGLDTHALAQRSIVPHLNSDPVPTPYLQELYARGKIGLKSGAGFYDWHGVDAAQVRQNATAKVGKILAFMDEIGVGRGRSVPR
jgi:3-hydroxybutyryl-CoA dehydrogenase